MYNKKNRTGSKNYLKKESFVLHRLFIQKLNVLLIKIMFYKVSISYIIKNNLKSSILYDYNSRKLLNIIVALLMHRKLTYLCIGQKYIICLN